MYIVRMHVCVCPRTTLRVLNAAAPDLAWVLSQWVTGMIVDF